MSSRRNHYSLVAAIVAATIAGKLPSAYAQQQTQPPAPATGEAAQNVDEVTVTGSRIKQHSDYTTPTPTTVLDSSVLENLGIVNVGQALQDIPANLSQFTPSNTANSSFFTGAYIPDLRGLNGFFNSRTLTLIDGQRVVQTEQSDAFDLNFIPGVLVQRVDTVTGGASAAYGSGAEAGVVNIIMDRKFEGVKFNADAAETEESDGQDRHLSAAWGHGFMDERIHVVVGGEYEHQNEVGCQNARYWCAKDAGFYQNGIAGNDTATYAAGTNLHSGVTGPGGVFFPQSGIPQGAGISTLGVSPDGTNVVPYSTGAVPFSTTGIAGGLNPATNTSTYIGGSGPPANEYTQLLPATTRGLITAMLTGKITDDITMKVDLNYGKTTAFSALGPGAISPSISAFGITDDITPQNAFIQNYPGLQSAVCGGGGLTAGKVVPALTTCANGAAGAALSSQFTQVPLTTQESTTLKRFSIGFDGKVPGLSSWTWDSYFTFGDTHQKYLEPNEIRDSSSIMGLDSVVGPNGQPMCRVTAAAMYAGNTNYIADVLNPSNPYYAPNTGYDGAGANLANNNALAAGCVPLNPFGTNAIPSNSLAYNFGNLDQELRYSQTVAALNATGDIYKGLGLGAGAFSMALGYEWRQEQGFNNEIQSCLPQDAGVTGPAVNGQVPTANTCTLRSQDFVAQFGTPFASDVTVNEAYAEFNLPIAKNLPWVHDSGLDIAGRFSRYDDKQLLALENNPTDPASLIPESGAGAIHNLSTFKISGFYEPVEGVRLRSSFSHDSRAPDFRELYYAQQLLPFGQNGGFGACTHPGVTTAANSFSDPCFWNLLGNVNLAPEVSDTTTAGIVLTPPQLPGLQLSADYFHIRITNAISPASVPQVELACDSSTAAACKQMEFNDVSYVGATSCAAAPTTAGCGTSEALTGAAAWAAGAQNATGVNATSFNGAFYETSGVDFSLTYTASLPDNSILTFRSLATWTGLDQYQNYQGGPIQDILGQNGGVGLLTDFTPAPKWQGNASLTWTKGILSITPNVRWIGPGRLDDDGVVGGPHDKNFTCPTNGTYGADLYQQVACGDPAATVVGYTLLPYNEVGSYFLFNLNATLNFEDKFGVKNIQIYAQVNNLFNRAPPLAAAPGGLFATGTSSTNPILYDTIGMDTRVGFRLIF